MEGWTVSKTSNTKADAYLELQRRDQVRPTTNKGDGER